MAYLPTPQQLRYLVMLAEKGHFGRAASACAVSQSTLSAGLLTLERGLDSQILDRAVAKHPVFTPLGLELVVKARAALSALSAIAEAADAARAPMSGPLRLGIIPTIGPFLLPRLMPQLRERYRALRLFLREDLTERLLDQLDAGLLDMVILAQPCACGRVEVLPLAQDEFLVAFPFGHRFMGRESIRGDEFAAEQLLLLEDGHCLREHVLAVCGTELKREQQFAATSLHTLVQMVAGGLGLTLVPKLAVDAGVLNGTGVQTTKLEGAAGWRNIALAWRAGSARTGEFKTLAPVIASACEF